jgi:hypothetical protein
MTSGRDTIWGIVSDRMWAMLPIDQALVTRALRDIGFLVKGSQHPCMFRVYWWQLFWFNSSW